ncbi:hypothetical protein [Hugenholtzia roseola]|uniref:hypothetical protein n=1 Tax=Hugenholtzia roseola TaxID=1002 RepID=UPI0003F5A123|nr:hypothetical protein [Hugenholtzia roseola]
MQCLHLYALILSKEFEKKGTTLSYQFIPSFKPQLCRTMNATQKIQEIENYLGSLFFNPYRRKSYAYAHDYQELLAAIELHLAQGKRHAKARNWQAAIHEYDTILLWQRNHTEALFLLADAYKNRWLDYGNKRDKEKSLAYAQHCLQVAPHHAEANELVHQIYTTSQLENIWESKHTYQVAFATLIATAMLACGVWAYHYFGFQLYQTESAPLTFSALDLIQQEPAAPNNQNTWLPTEATQAAQRTMQQVPVEFLYQHQNQHLQLHLSVEQSLYRAYQEAYSYNLLADVAVQGANVALLKLKVDLVDAAGTILRTDWIDLVQPHEQLAHAGEVLPLHYLEYEEGQNLDLAKIQITVAEIQWIEQNETAFIQEKELLWQTAPLEGTEIVIKERKNELLDAQGDGTYHHIEWQIGNKGENPVQSLQVEIAWYNQKGQIVEARTTYLTHSSQPSLKSKQKRSENRTYRLANIKAEDIATYTLTVIDAH